MLERELIEDLLKYSEEKQDYSVFYIYYVSLISADNNLLDEEIDENILNLRILLKVLDEDKYQNNSELVNIKERIVNYVKKYEK